jgi:hypothetical protein
MRKSFVNHIFFDYEIIMNNNLKDEFIISAWQGYEIDSSEYFITVYHQSLQFLVKCISSPYISNNVKWYSLHRYLKKLNEDTEIKAFSMNYDEIGDKQFKKIEFIEELPTTIDQWLQYQKGISRKQAIALYFFIDKLSDHELVDEEALLKIANISYRILGPEELPPFVNQPPGNYHPEGQEMVPVPMFNETPDNKYMIEWYMDEYRYYVLDKLGYNYFIHPL